MKKGKISSIALVVILIIVFALAAYAGATKTDDSSFGWVSLLPPVLAIVLAFLTKQVLLSLFLGIFIGAMMLNGGNPFYGFLRT
ncbi:hypothetical protein [Caldisalinibacter kiritimatiensis]|uniref:Na+/H+ antiporter NhaC n=1 Tax=Caldisalinibacter kiritimatiensis TaxID=1304284 RepID=R1CY57_9FIRM|nr:hypothetical protein [Caldisalinibacter kiritimatiensis]EOD01504.1 Na+/H+ antiporter NhaC [Caldisalinibacter kiritimatiensis]